MDERERNNILVKVEGFELQLKRIVSDYESEKDTRKRITDHIDRRFDKLDDKLEGEQGLLFRIKILENEATKREKNSNQIKGLWIGLIITVVSSVISFLFTLLHK